MRKLLTGKLDAGTMVTLVGPSKVEGYVVVRTTTGLYIRVSASAV